MTQLQVFALIALFIYFVLILYAVTKEKKNQNLLDYFFGGRKLPFWALSITFIASWWGAGSALATADLAYEDGLGAFWYYGVPVLLSTFLMIIGSKKIRRVGFLTQGEMMRARYNKKVSTVLSLLILVFMIFTAASQMVAIGEFFGTYMGLNYELAVLIGTGIVLGYSLFGGFRGVVLTDIIQFIFLSVSALIVFLVALNASGGIDAIQNVADKKGLTNYMSFTEGASKYFSYVITFGCAWMIQANVWQRISAAKSDTDARKMTIMSFFVYIPLYLMIVLTGMASLSLFETIPKGGIVTTIVINYMHPILGAIVFVGITAAIMSTMDSLINTGAMTILLDLYKGDGSDKKKLSLSYLATLFVTLIALLIALQIRSILEISWIASDIITTGVFVPLMAAFLWRRGTAKGAIASMIAGFIYSFYNLMVSFSIFPKPFYESQSVMQVVIGVLISFIVYISISLTTKAEYDKADKFISMTR